jgi:hypothetical protein
MQHRSPEDQRGRVISANNIMNALFMVAGAVGAIGISALDPRPAALLLVLAAGNLAVSSYMVWLLPDSVQKRAVLRALKIVFRIPAHAPGNSGAQEPDP